MHSARFLLPVLLALAAAGCAREQQAYLVDPATGRAVPVVVQQQPVQPQYTQQAYQQPSPPVATRGERGLFNSWQSTPPQYAQQNFPQQTYQPPASSGGRGLFTSPPSAPAAYVQMSPQQPYAMQYGAPHYATPATGGRFVPAPNGGFAAASLY